MNVLIGGPARSGKTHLARQVSGGLGYSHIPLDALVSAFQQHLPETGIKHEGLEWDSICTNFLPFLTTFLQELSYEGTSFVCDTYHIRPRAAAELRQAQNLTVVFLGYPNIDLEVKINSIRKFRAAHDWTDSLPDQDLKVLAQKFKAESLIIQAECKQFDIPFFDTGTNFEQGLSEACSWLTKKASIGATTG